MAIDFSKYNFLNKLSARSRMFVLLGAVVGILFLVYLGTRYFMGESETTGPSKVATAPPGLQSVQGGQLTPDYYRALSQANVQAAQQAQISGGSAVPTLINIGQQGTASCIICSDQSTNVKTLLDDWVRQGKISPDTAARLQELADKNVSVEDYAAELARLVKEGKLTPEQARQLLEQYKKQHANAQLADSSQLMDEMIKSGQLPLDVANQLLDAQKSKVSPAEYAAMLQDLVRQGKLSPEAAQRLLAQYTQQRAREVTEQSIASLRQMARDGELTPDVEKALIEYENAMVPFDTYAARLDEYIKTGKITPAVAAKILDEYRRQKDAIGPTATINQLLQAAEAAAYGELNDLVKAGKISQETATAIADKIRANVSLAEHQALINQLVQENKLTPDIAKQKIADYKEVKRLREAAARLAALQGNNVSPAEYAEELKRLVAEGKLTPEEAARLMQEYQALSTRGAVSTTPIAGTDEFSRLQQRVEAGVTSAGPAAGTGDFAAAQTQASAEEAQARQARIEAMLNAMQGQAQQLVASWQPPTMEHKEGAPAVLDGKDGTTTKTTTTTTKSGTGDQASGTETPPMVKAGTVLFAVLDTAVNSDYPDSPVMATIVDGKYKGAKLLGKLTTVKGVSGQMDRVGLNFTLMNKDDWIKSKSVTAYAIDPDTSRTQLASAVNYHYLKRFGAIMATSFLQGYSTAITNAGTTTIGAGVSTATRPELNPSSKIMVGLGQMGQTLGAATQNYINIPPTVKVDAGVGLGILFMSDVT